MKRFIAIMCVLLTALSSKAQEEKIVPSKITNVTVYTQGAQIYQTAAYTVGKGVTQVILEGISPNIDANSLQVKATGNVVLLDSKYSVYYPKPSEVKLEGLPLKIQKSIIALEDSIKNMNYDIQSLQDEIDVLNSTKSILTSNGAIRGQGKVNDSIALLKEAIEYYSVKMTSINKQLHALNRSKAEKNEVLQKMHERLVEYQNHQASENGNPMPKGPIHRITVTLSSGETANGKLNVSYLVSSAGWTPMYDLRSEISGGSINLSYKAQVYQSTGVDWVDIPLSISTNNPYQNKTKPTLHPWYIDFNLYGNLRQTNSGINQYKESNVPAPTMAGTLSIGQAEDKDALYSDQFVTVIEHMISAEFKIDLPYTIKSNNEQHMVLVKNVDLPADFKYYTVPKYDNGVYLVAQLSKLDELQLVPAKANIFFDGSYVGETYLDPTTMEDTLNLSLGKDPNIIVKRTLLKKEYKEKIIGTKKERAYAYSIEVKNNKSTSVTIVVQDQIPITQNAEIEIEAVDLSKGVLEERTGIIEWEVDLKPAGKKDILLKYTVRHDKDQTVPID